MKDNDLEITRSGGWKIVKPAEHKAEEPILDDLARQLATLRVDRAAALAPADLKPFGLDSPAAVVTIVTDKEGSPVTTGLKIGAPVDPKDSSGDRYVMVEGSKVVGVLDRILARRLLAPVHRGRRLRVGRGPRRPESAVRSQRRRSAVRRT